MGRKIAAVVVGYLVMFIVVFCTFSAAYIGMGADRAFEPASYRVSIIWIVTSIVLGFIAALAGGYVAAAIGRSQDSAKHLAIFVLLLGILFAIPAFNAERAQKVRTADVPNMEAMQHAAPPAWLAILNPVIGAVGAFAGGRMRKS